MVLAVDYLVIQTHHQLQMFISHYLNKIRVDFRSSPTVCKMMAGLLNSLEIVLHDFSSMNNATVYNGFIFIQRSL